MNSQARDLLPFRLDQPSLFDLSHLTYLQVNGDKALDFLQGQLTCDVKQVCATTMVQGALCNLKGRVLALLDVFFWQGTYGLLLPTNLVPVLQKDLQLIAKLSRVTLTTHSKDTVPKVHCFGLYIPQGTEVQKLPFNLPQTPHAFISTDGMACYALDHQLFIILCPAANHVLSAFPTVLEGKAWHQLLLIHDHPTLHPETSGLFLPHQLQLDKSGQVSFKKGCYKGQEIIARMHYLGKNKYCLHTNIIQSETPIHPGMSLQTSSNQSMGEVVDVVALDNQSYFILANILQSFEQQFLNTTRY